MKPYLINLCEAIDEVMTLDHKEWDKHLLKVLHTHLSDYENQAEGTLESFLSDVEDAILKCSGESVLR